jgi:hypothetical protein
MSATKRFSEAEDERAGKKSKPRAREANPHNNGSGLSLALGLIIIIANFDLQLLKFLV